MRPEAEGGLRKRVDGRTSGVASPWRAALSRNVLVLGAVSLLTDASSELILWTIPFYVALLGGGIVWIGLVEGLRESLASLLKLGSGWLSDRLGKRKALAAIGYGVSSLAKPLLAVAGAPWHVLGLLGLERVGKGIRTAPRDALLAGAAPESVRARAFSIHRAFDHAGAVVGLAAGAALAGWLFARYRAASEAGADLVPADVFRTMYVVAAVPAALAVVVIVLFLHEKTADRKRIRIGFRAAYDRRFWTFLVALLIFALGNSSDLLLLVRAGEVLGYDLALTETERAGAAEAWSFPWQLPLMYLALSLAKMAFTLPGGALADRIGRAPTLALGWAVYAAVYFAFGLATEAWQIWALLVAYGLFHGFTEGVEKALVADYVRPEVRGAAYGLHAFTDGIAKLPASLLLGILYQSFGAAVAFGFGGACAAVASAILLTMVLRGRSRA